MKKIQTIQQQISPLGRLVKVTVTGAAGNIGYALVFMISQGYLLDKKTRINLCLLELPSQIEKLKGVQCELNDSASPLLNSVVITSDEEVAFKDCDIAILVGAKPRTKGMERKDLLTANGKIFKTHAENLD